MDVLMPQMGETVASGTITNWMKVVGDHVESGDVLFEIDSDKAAMEVPATSAGTITEIRVKTGESAPVGAVVAVISGGKESPPADKSANNAAPLAKPVASFSPAPEPLSVNIAAGKSQEIKNPFGRARLPDGTLVTPLARRLAHQARIDLGALRGSGPRGRIQAADVKRAIESGGTPSPARREDTPQLSVASVKAAYGSTSFTEIPLDGMRRTIAARLTESKQTVPHFYIATDVLLEPVLALRIQINAFNEQKISLNDFVVKAYALALQRTPAANAVWNGNSILQFKQVDVGVAVAVEGGLFTPVIRNAEEKTVGTISAEIKDLAERARNRKLKPDEYAGGTASISNLGMYGVNNFSAIINPPQSSILAVGAGARRPVELDDGSIKFVSQMTVTLSADHRVIDGAVAAELLKTFKRFMEEPITMLV